MKAPRTRRGREIVEGLKKAFVWAFLAVFLISVLGVAVVSIGR